MSDRVGLKEKWAPVGKALINAREQRKLANMSSSFHGDGRIREDALAASLPAYIFSWYLSGTPSTGTNVAEEYDLSSRVKVGTLRARVKTAPTTNEFTVRLTANGAEVETVSIGIGQTSARSPINTTFDAGTVLRIDVLTVGGAANATVSVGYAAAI